MVVGDAAEYATYPGVVVVWMTVLCHAVAVGELPCSIRGITWINVAASHPCVLSRHPISVSMP